VSEPAREPRPADPGDGNGEAGPSRRPALNFRTKLVAISTAISLVCLLIAAFAMATHQHFVLRKVLEQRAGTLADVMAESSQAALIFEDRTAATLVLANLSPEASVEEARLLRRLPDQSLADTPTFAAFFRDAQGANALPEVAVGGLLREGSRVHVLRAVNRGEDTIGYVYLRVHLAELDALLQNFVLVVIALALGTIVVAWMLSSRLQGMVTRPVGELLSTTDAVRVTKDYSLRAKVLGADELGRLTAAVNAMLAEVQAHDAAREEVESDMRDLNEQLEQKVHLRTQDLEASNLDLQEAIETLRRTQRQLVESEKLAALGALVAGVAHEINTPLGVCVTVASHLEDAITSLRRSYSEGIRRTDLERFLDDGRQAVEIINGNLRRAADLVRSFKQVAVDQGTEDRRRINARDYLGEVLRSVSPELKRHRIRVDLDCADDIILDTFPGVLAQVLTNLAINARQHAFPTEHADPRIKVRGRREGNEFVMEFSDNGGGMTEDVRQRIFEPFFTTRRGSGGSGLGLHIVYNQVNNQLRGRIDCISAPDEGARFVLRMPVNTPAVTPAATESVDPL
jgi:signal transduction histidine kinase